MLDSDIRYGGTYLQVCIVQVLARLEHDQHNTLNFRSSARAIFRVGLRSRTGLREMKARKGLDVRAGSALQSTDHLGENVAEKLKSDRQAS
jgi:hypothetical protein